MNSNNQNDKVIESGSGGQGTWKAEFLRNEPGKMVFSVDGKQIAVFSGVELGVLKEAKGINIFTRIHEEEKTDWKWAETKVLLPFGAEPEIKRIWEQSGNHIRVTTDIQISTNMSPENISVDAITLPGKWERADVYYFEGGQRGYDIRKRTIDLERNEDFKHEFQTVPLVIRLVNMDGLVFEIGTGYDLWRWMGADRNENAKSSFSLKITHGSVRLERIPLIFGREHIISKSNFRFTWYFAWGRADAASSMTIPSKINLLTAEQGRLRSDNQAPDDAYMLNCSSWPISACIKGLNPQMPCYCSRQTENLLKHWIRFLQSVRQGGDILLAEIEPHVCLNSSHLERGEGKEMLHWDYPYILAFKAWAVRQLAGKGMNFRIQLPKDSLFSGLPSASGLKD